MAEDCNSLNLSIKRIKGNNFPGKIKLLLAAQASMLRFMQTYTTFIQRNIECTDHYMYRIYSCV